MHELSIAISLIELAENAANQAGATNIIAVHLRLGILSGVVKDSLLLAYDIAKENTLLADAKLIIEELPLLIHCNHCKAGYQLETLSCLECPACGLPASEILQGREIELSFLEAADETEIA